MYHQRMEIQDAVHEGAKMIHDSYERFYDEEQELYKEVDSEHIADVKAYVQAFKDLVMCNLHWR